MRASILPLLVVGLTSVGCVSLGRYQELELRVVAMEKFREETLQAAKTNQERLEELVGRIKTQADELKKATANSTAKGNDLADDQRRLKGQIEELDFTAVRLGGQVEVMRKFMEQRFGTTLLALPPDVPKDPKAMFKYGMDKLKAGQVDIGRAVLRQFAHENPTDPDAPKALLAIGDSYRTAKDWNSALKVYKDIFERYKDKPEAPTALFLAGKALHDQKKCKEAQGMWKYLIQNFPKSPESTEAKGLLKLKC